MVEDASLPKFRQARLFGGISAITEGWALYAERLAAESGWYADDPEGLLGQMDKPSCFARADSSSTPACTPSGGRASRPSTTASRRAKSNDTSSIPARRART